ncbi:hypothetical protein A6769_37275 [Nostoc punctiforme NIES-2108]|uniref:Uncharacterized protein n=1 Tax=Nostoc punctiforme NIES-2108 TaxID=1356359 RepID=A0A367S118_NOSPU|nr:hypothetical protein A6769_37275 [Nostoc punctiforme NIES-2108]
MPQTYQERKINKIKKEFWLTKEDNQILETLAKKHNLTELNLIQIALKLLEDTKILDECEITTFKPNKYSKPISVVTSKIKVKNDSTVNTDSTITSNTSITDDSKVLVCSK